MDRKIFTCPSCSNEASILAINNPNFAWVVQCTECPFSVEDTLKDNAITLWNTRAETPKEKKYREALEDIKKWNLSGDLIIDCIAKKALEEK